MSLLTVAGISMIEEGSAVLKDISFTLQELQKIAIAGETGSGKSTLLQVIAGLVQPSAGQVLFDGERVKGPTEKLVPGHPGIAYLSQQFELQKFLRVEQVLAYANTLTDEEAANIYEICRISHLLKRRTNQLSGGERQRIALAKLLVSSPRLLLLDEPFSNLDTAHKDTLKAVIQAIGDQLEITCILISHDPHDTLPWADEILVMRGGQILQKGTPAQLYRQPVNEYVAALFGSYNLIAPAQAKAFAALPSMQVNGKSILIRPESFRLVAVGSQALAGTVTKVAFFGSYCQLEVQLPGIMITMKTGDNHVKAGDEVYVSFSPDAVSYV
ncbi:ABC transporter ATP-binding protein [Pontibacter chitinilyticus]|uniref:ABC transporter ATP-binding protein n=1 Tax=Pontibacter chitinilyticus TaxID=2674989 RepID=UPI003219A823